MFRSVHLFCLLAVCPAVSEAAVLPASCPETLAGAPLLEQTLEIREALLGEEHPDTAESLNNLGAALLQSGDVTGARPLIEQSLAVREAADPIGLVTATSLHNLGALLVQSGNPDEAVPLLARALSIREGALGAESAETASALDELCGALSKAGRGPDADHRCSAR